MIACADRSILQGRLERDVPLARYTSWRVGGPADRLYLPADRVDLLAFIAELPAEEPLHWIGLGSNLLVRDGGLRGTVIVLHGALNTLHLEAADGSVLAPDAPLPAEARVYAEAGVHCARLAKFAERAALAGLGFMAGIPGTVGGALAMNAGAWGGETWPAVAAVEIVQRGGTTRWLSPDTVHFAYREVRLPEDAIGLIAARFRVQADEDGSHAAAVRSQLARRKATQPVGRPSAGSTFRNPEGDFAARLIEAAGLKGYRMGGAEVSAQHANFILTSEGARASDVERLIAHIQHTVRERTGVALQPEVRVVGEPLEGQS